MPIAGDGIGAETAHSVDGRFAATSARFPKRSSQPV